MNNMRNLYKMQMQEEKRDETRSPYINELLQLAELIKEGTKGAEDFNAAIGALGEFFNNIRTAADYLKQTQPPSDDFEEKYARLIELLSLIEQEAANMGVFFEDGAPESIDVPAENIKTYTAELFNITDDLSKTEASQPQYAGAIEISELVRVGKGYCNGDFALEAFAGRHSLASNLITSAAADMRNFEGVEGETELLREAVPVLIKNLNEMEAACNAIGEMIEAGGEDKEKIQENLEIVRRTAEVVTDLNNKINEENAKIQEEKSKRICPRCGKKTSVYEEHCEHCRMLLPPVEGVSKNTAGLNIVAGDAGVSGQAASAVAEEGKRLVTPNVAKLYDIAVEVGNGRMPKEELGKAIDWYGELVLKTRSDLNAVSIPEELGDEEKAVFERAYAVFSEGVTSSEAGLNELAAYFQDENVSHLIDGINLLITGGEKMYEFQQMGDVFQSIASSAAQQPAEEEAEEADDPTLA